ncbi:hypothetical protein O3M35_012052 [Rhynocoris fuscipes]|uniref:Uncharacterized protein n=1 Tax=Rhynocoris fuscipes TaxID=488301 RepID=A0AAW1CYZ4_9HEMI
MMLKMTQITKKKIKIKKFMLTTLIRKKSLIHSEIKSKLSNIRMEYNKFLSWLKPIHTKFATLSCSVGNTVGPIHLKF